jgi:hypothetical protein
MGVNKTETQQRSLLWTQLIDYKYRRDNKDTTWHRNVWQPNSYQVSLKPLPGNKLRIELYSKGAQVGKTRVRRYKIVDSCIVMRQHIFIPFAPFFFINTRRVVRLGFVADGIFVDSKEKSSGMILLMGGGNSNWSSGIYHRAVNSVEASEVRR